MCHWVRENEILGLQVGHALKIMAKKTKSHPDSGLRCGQTPLDDHSYLCIRQSPSGAMVYLCVVRREKK